MYEPIVSLFLKSIEPLYSWFSENLFAHLMTFSKELGALIVFVSAVAFLLITIYFVMKQAKKLPKRYVLETFDQDGKKTVIPELRITFGTYQAAASYAEYYTKLYKYKYKFRLLGIKDNISTLGRLKH
ncbi:MAG TPA: hypothetical protein VE378_04585 [Nitrososphaeraceae archaeon]|nr:hypothetical protein [Nitrososphaeraceae archaeon]